jgi:hypothetical protein
VCQPPHFYPLVRRRIFRADAPSSARFHALLHAPRENSASSFFTDGWKTGRTGYFFFFRARRLSFFLLFFQVDPGPRTSSRSRRAAQSWLTATWTSKLGLSSSALSRARHGRVPRYVIITSSLAVLLRYTSLHVDTQMLAKVLSIVSGPTTCPRRTLDVRICDGFFVSDRRCGPACCFMLPSGLGFANHDCLTRRLLSYMEALLIFVHFFSPGHASSTLATRFRLFSVAIG